MATARITGTGPTEMKALAARLHGADAELKRELRRNFRNIAQPIARRAQASILEMRSVSQKGSLREDIARTVYASTGVTKTGVRIDVVSRGQRMPEGESTLPKHADSRRGWWHPVYAQGPRASWKWAHQWGKAQWFEDPIGRSGRDAQAAAQRALDTVLRKLG